MWHERRGRTRLGVQAVTWVLALFPMGDPGSVDDPGRRVERSFPVVGRTDYAGAHHDYPATDIFADCGSRVVSPVSGVLTEVRSTDRWDPATDRGAARGGKSFTVVGEDGVRYYGSHLSVVRHDLRPGQAVTSGQVLGRVGRTGSARSTPCHLHLGLSPACQGRGEWWVRRGVVGPYRFLRRWEAGERSSPAHAVARWKRRHGCPVGP